jgi:hypothetical protein
MKVECDQCLPSQECGFFHQTRGYFQCDPPYMTDEELEVFARESNKLLRRLQDERTGTNGNDGNSQ